MHLVSLEHQQPRCSCTWCFSLLLHPGANCNDFVVRHHLKCFVSAFFVASGPHGVGRSQRERGCFFEGACGCCVSQGSSGIQGCQEMKWGGHIGRSGGIGKCNLNLWNEAIRMIWCSFSRRPFFMVWQKVLRRPDWRGHGTVKTELRIPMVSLQVGVIYIFEKCRCLNDFDGVSLILLWGLDPWPEKRPFG